MFSEISVRRVNRKKEHMILKHIAWREALYLLREADRKFTVLTISGFRPLVLPISLGCRRSRGFGKWRYCSVSVRQKREHYFLPKKTQTFAIFKTKPLILNRKISVFFVKTMRSINTIKRKVVPFHDAKV